MKMEHTTSSETHQTTRCHHYPHNSMEQCPCSELTHIPYKKKNTTFYESSRFITVLTKARHWTTCWGQHTFSCRPSLRLPSFNALSGFKTQSARNWHTANVPRALPTPPPPLLDFIAQHKARNFSLCRFLPSRVTSTLLAACFIRRSTFSTSSAGALLSAATELATSHCCILHSSKA